MYAKKCFLVLMALAITLSLFAAFPAQPALAARCTQWHTVQRGETLATIGAAYGVSWRTLANLNNLSNPSRIYAGQELCVSTSGSTYSSGGTTTGSSKPYFIITSINKNQTITIRTYNFPVYEKFKVLMGPYKTKGVGGARGDSLEIFGNGSVTATVKIPKEMHNERRIAVRLYSLDSDTIVWNWFYNHTFTWYGGGGQTIPGGSSGGSSGYVPQSGYPTIAIVSVNADNSVTIRGRSFPDNDVFTVRMGRMGTNGRNGISSGTYSTGDGGSFTATFDIPDELLGLKQIAIRMESSDSGYYAYNWFYAP